MIPGSSVSGFFRTRDSQYQIERSLRFNRADSAYLERTTTTTGTDNRIGTWSFWIKRTELGARSFVIADTTNNSSSTYFEFGSDDTINVYDNNTPMNFATTAVFRDPTAWMHIVMYFDTTQATSTNRFRLYVNGAQVTAFSAATYPSQNATLNFGISGVALRIGRSALSIYSAYYLTEFRYIDGQALTPSHFGETNATTGAWNPKAYSGSYGTNGFFLKFADNSGTTSTTLGKDSSDNGNNWTPNNFSVTAGAGNDSLTDTPTNYGTGTDTGGVMRGNYCTLNPMDRDNGGSYTLTNGNLQVTSDTTRAGRSTFAVNSGKWYWEVEFTGLTSNSDMVGILSSAQAYSVGNSAGFYSGGYCYVQASGNKQNNNSSVAYGASYTNGDVIGIALDMTNGKVFFAKNNVWQASGDPVAGTNAAYTGLSGLFSPVASPAVGSTHYFNFGQRAFTYTPPTGFLSLCTQNIATPVAALQNPRKGYATTLYTGTGATLSITGLSFGPDFVWIKSRSAATDHSLYDAQRGTQARLESNNTDAEATSDNGLTAFGSAGFTLGTLAQVNTSSATYVAWCWEESATYGFDIVTYTGNGSNRNVSHSLGVTPQFFIVKDYSTAGYGWHCWHTSLSSTTDSYIQLESTGAAGSLSAIWNTGPSSTYIGIGTYNGVNQSSKTHVAYIWAPVAGFSFFGSYTGNGSTDGPYVATGMRPAWYIYKRFSSAADWYIIDSGRSPYNPVTAYFQNTSGAETTGGSANFDPDWDFLATGMKCRDAPGDVNTNGSSCLVVGFAQDAFKYARAR